MPSDQRLFAIANALTKGYSVDRIWEMTKIDKWFLNKLARIIKMEKHLGNLTTKSISAHDMQLAKQLGFSDKQIAAKLGSNEIEIRKLRQSYGITPFVKQIDTGMKKWSIHSANC